MDGLNAVPSSAVHVWAKVRTEHVRVSVRALHAQCHNNVQLLMALCAGSGSWEPAAATVATGMTPDRTVVRIGRTWRKAGSAHSTAGRGRRRHNLHPARKAGVSRWNTGGLRLSAREKPSWPV